MLLLRPMAAIAMTIKNFERVLSGAKKASFTPAFMHTVVIRAAIIKYNMNIGKARLKLKLPEDVPSFFAAFARTTARTSVIGIIASVLVSFTVTALSRVWVPRFHMLSHVEAAAVTDDVSFTAVPAKIPKALPLVVSKPMAFPRIGNNIAAITLKKKITDIA